ncbi:MAG: hypothetical protein CBARDMAM_6304 [uncultured Caballeronia sp.]|nr:MAG: hypothetical protein CBARDMAM_6304 [uncultured Caballeronia sp.]
MMIYSNFTRTYVYVLPVAVHAYRGAAMPSIDLNPEHTALISINLQTSNLARQLAPHSAADVLGKTVQLANAL